MCCPGHVHGLAAPLAAHFPTCVGCYGRYHLAHTYDVFGLVERSDESMALVAWAFGWGSFFRERYLPPLPASLPSANNSANDTTHTVANVPGTFCRIGDPYCERVVSSDTLH